MHIPGKRGSPLWLLCNQPNYKNYGEIHIEGVEAAYINRSREGHHAQ